nr:PTS transporter subunit EIIC [Liquorilactobacillus satsumensis]
MKKTIPSAVENIFAPLISLILLVPLTIILFGPLGSILSNEIASLYMNLYGLNRMIAGAFIGFFAQAMVVFGIHWGLISNYFF